MSPRSPLLRLLLERPQLLTEHLGAYGELLAADGATLVARAERRVLLLALAGGLAAATAGLAGVALMLAAVLHALLSLVPTAPTALGVATLPASLWLTLLLVPTLTALGAWWAGHRARHDRADRPFAVLREQLLADLAVLREAGLTGERR